MMQSEFLKVLKTASSQISKKSLFRSRSTYYTPDLFFASLYLSLFVFSAVFDIVFALRIFLYDEKAVSGVIFLLTIIIPGIFDFFFWRDVTSVNVNKWFRLLFSTLGFNAVFNFARVCSEIFTIAGNGVTKPLKCFTYPFFQITTESLSAIKIHCLINSALKSLPRLFILPVLILHNNLKGISAFLGLTLIMVNMVVFSLTMAVTLPIRPMPRVYTSSVCVLLNAFNKFMATMCCCGVILAIFGTVFKSIHFYSLLIPFFRFITWAWPCWNVLRSQSVPLTRLGFSIYFILFTFISSFIYIHPFEGIGKLHYYVFYFLDFLEEILVIYLFTEVSLDSITGYFCFRVLMIGFLSTFGLVNILHKSKDEKTNYACVSYTIVPSEKAENKGSTDKVQTVVIQQMEPKK